MSTTEDRAVDEWLDPQTVQDFTLEAMDRRYNNIQCWHFWRKRPRVVKSKLGGSKRMCGSCYIDLWDHQYTEVSPAIAGICVALALSFVVIMLGVGLGMLLKALV